MTKAQLRELARAAKTAPFRVKLVLALLVLYLASPLDLIPDFIPVLGQLDDVLIAGVVLRYVVKQIPEIQDLLPTRKKK